VNIKNFFGLLKEAGKEWLDDKAPRLGAALSYYTVFAIPPLLIIVLFIVSLVFDPNKVRQELFSEVGGLIGPKSAQAIESAMASQYQNNRGLIASAIAVVTLLITATGLFIELQDALNTIWRVEAKSGQGMMGFIKTRLLSFAMVVGIGFLLLVSLVVSTALSALSKYISMLVPGMDILWMVVNDAVSFLVITVLFAMIFKVLPDVKIRWRSVWLGAAVTSALFTGGKFLLGLYLGKNSTVSAYGAAGSVILILLWVYYSAQILFYGAEVSKVYALKFGTRPKPASHAQWSARADELPAATTPVRAQPGRKARLVASLKAEVESLRELVER
jgi:membrane protein